MFNGFFKTNSKSKFNSFSIGFEYYDVHNTNVALFIERKLDVQLNSATV
jgi:hypothetical protein